MINSDYIVIANYSQVKQCAPLRRGVAHNVRRYKDEVTWYVLVALHLHNPVFFSSAGDYGNE